MRRQAIYGLAVVLLIIGAIWQLSIIPSSAAQVEVDAYNQTNNVANIIDNPLSLPYKVPAYVATKVSGSVRILRALSALFFSFSIIALYRILKRWHSDKIALFSAVLFATNATALAVGRLGTPLVLLFGWSLIISILLWLYYGNSTRVAPVSLAFISAGLLYVPGALYFFILLLIIFGRKLTKLIPSMTKNAFILSIFIALLVIAPLIYTFVSDVGLLKQWLLLPQEINPELIPRNILRIPSAFIYRAPVDPLLDTGRLPIFDIASGMLFLIGLYAYQKHVKLERTKVMLLTALFSIVLGALGQTQIAIILVLPFAYAVVAAGISYLLDQWYGIFPKNPFARSFGLILITAVVLASSYYQITRFLVVWPQTPETRQVYNQPRLIQ